MFGKIIRFLFPLRYAIKKGLKLGQGVSFASPRSVVFGTEPYLIEIGDFVRISGRVAFITHDGGTWAFRYKQEYRNVFKYGRILIGEHSFIGYASIIMPGVKIGKNCVIGAGSIVTKNVPDGSVVAGVPAKFICSTEEYAKKITEIMPRDVNWDNYRKNKKEELIGLYLKNKKN